MMARDPYAPIEILRAKGRIAGFALPKVPTQIIWCGTSRPRKKTGNRRDGWSFPPAVREVLLQECEGKTVLHLFGGKADFGVRLDIDPETNPDVLGDAWVPPFEKNSFDVVILDPPYIGLNRQERMALLRAATWISRELVIWFHSMWIRTDRGLVLDHAYFVRVGEQCSMRCLQVFKSLPSKLPPVQFFERGPAMKYNRWLSGELPLPFEEGCLMPNPESPVIGAARPKANPRMSAVGAGVRSRVLTESKGFARRAANDLTPGRAFADGGKSAVRV